MANFFDQFDTVPETPGRPRITVTPARPALDDRSRDLAIRTIYGEAGQEPDEGMAAVAHVIRNRTQAGRYGGSSVPDVVLARNQFEPWNGGPARARMEALRPDSPEYQRIGGIVDRVFGGQLPDPTGGMTHFYSPSAQAALGRQPPRWAQGENIPIGRHTFFAPEGKVGGQQAAAANFFDQFDGQPATPPAAPVQAPGDMGGYAPSQIPVAGQDIGRMEAAARGALAGATANFGDELAGIRAAGGGAGVQMPGIPVNTGDIFGLARLGYEMMTGQRGPATEAYEKARDASRSDLAQAQEQYPGATMAGQVAGAVALPGGMAIRAPTMAGRAIQAAGVGAGYGAAAGAGEGTTAEDRALRGATGAAVGGAAGAVGSPAMELAGRGIAALARPVASTVRGAFNPEAEAARRVVTGLTRDMQAGTAGVTPGQFAQARTAGAPVAVADMGGETTRALARSAANTSPEGRAALQNLADARFEGQADRATDFIRRLVGVTDTHATREGLQATARGVNRPAYEAAYRAPNAQGMWDEGLDQLSQAPVVQEAIRAAFVTGRNRGALEGFPPVNIPFVLDRATGRYNLRPPGPDGQQVLPNLQFWDHVKRNLDRLGTREAQDAARILRGHLDELVPEYRTARAGAARFFGAEDALEAGENFVRSNMSAAEGARALARMSPAERDLFRQGFAARLIDDLNGTRDRVNVLNRIGQSNEARAKLNAALGPQGARQVEAFMAVEQAMDRLRTAVQGNSTTARQLMELGLAGGTYGYGQMTGDPSAMMNAGIVYALLRGQRGIDQRVARRVADMLVSNDPQVLARGVRMAAGNRRITEALRALDSQLARISGQQGTGVMGPQAAGIGRAEDEQSVPRPPSQ